MRKTSALQHRVGTAAQDSIRTMLRRLGAVTRACIGLLLATAAAAVHAQGLETYIVLYQKSSVPAAVANTVASAGGTLVANYAQIGVVIARSGNVGFASTMRRSKGVQAVSATTRFAVRRDGGSSGADRLNPASAEDAPVSIPAPGSDNLSGLQWDMDQILAPAARAINGGSPTVVVGDIDTGIDYTHPDLAPNVDFANSVSCIGGVPNTAPGAWMDDNGHGTHTAGTIAAARNGMGIVGVAPNVKIAGIKAGDAQGYFFPESVVCAFMWVATHKIAVTNNSYFADPWLFNCRNDPEQRAIWEAERRAIRLAMQNGAVVVASMGNDADDLAHPTMDVTSPDDSTPISREVTNACAVIPAEIAGVVGVSANGSRRLKSYYSNYGVGTTALVAPGGDAVLQRTAGAPNGLVLSTWPSLLIEGCGRKVYDSSGATYCYLQGTSMAGPHVAGVAALIASNGVRSAGAIASRLIGTADHLACPSDVSIYSFFPSISNGAAQTCQGDLFYNSFNGNGQVNALRAITE